MALFSKKQFLADGWAEGPLAHGNYKPSGVQENEFFMQWIHPLKLHRVALRTPVGYRCTHGLADDVINDDMGIDVPDEKEITMKKNRSLGDYLKSRNWIKEMRKFTGNLYEQGEAIVLRYYNEITDEEDDYFEKPIPLNTEILGYEAFNLRDYKVLRWDENGKPLLYSIGLRNPYTRGTRQVKVHASRVKRLVDKELDERETGYPILAVVYDSIIILTNIVKATGEAAFRWGTGHPLILTKNITDDTEVAKIKGFIGDPTRRSWHILPSEFIEKFELVSQAGHMLNLKALYDIALENIIIATKIPRGVFLGESQVAQGEVEDRNYYGLLYEKHVQLESFVRECWEEDISVRRILSDIPYYNINWGIRETLSKMDEIEYRQRNISNALALSSFCTYNECRQEAGFPPLPEPIGNMIISLTDLYFMGGEQKEGDESNDYKETTKSTKDRAARGKDLEKDKTIYSPNKLRENKKQVRDALTELRGGHSVDEICEMIGWSKNTYYKLEKWSNEDE